MKKIVLLSFSLILYSGCNLSQKDSSGYLAEVNGVTLSIEDATSSISPYELSKDSIAALIRYRDEWINDQLIEQEIDRLNFDKDPAIKLKIDQAIKRTLYLSFQEAILSAAQENTTVSDDEVRNYYQENRDKFVLSERYVRFRHLTAPNLANAQQAKRELMQGNEWQQVARDYSVNPSLAISNSTRFYPESTALKEYSVLNRYLGLIGVSEISIIENINGQYHFVQLVEERAKGDHPDLQWLLDQIKDRLILEKKRSTYNRYIKNLYLAAQANNEIKVFNVLLEPVTTQIESKSDSLNTN